jgi:hypothetical protein
MRHEPNLPVLSHLPINSLIMSVPVSQQAISECWPRQALSYHKGIISECFKQFA